MSGLKKSLIPLFRNVATARTHGMILPVARRSLHFFTPPRASARLQRAGLLVRITTTTSPARARAHTRAAADDA
jgi:hypothetical protein